MRVRITVCLYATAVLLWSGIVLSGEPLSVVRRALSLSAPHAYAAGEQNEKYPYGGSKSGEYGEKKAVTSMAEARKVLREYFSKRDVKIGEIREKEFYFEAEIKDRNNNMVDKVIVDKRTGRIRSIY
ncbi:MAG TPA: hypothetical protein VF790_01520 [Dissulfurispiraceae bacterium]